MKETARRGQGCRRNLDVHAALWKRRGVFPSAEWTYWSSHLGIEKWTLGLLTLTWLIKCLYSSGPGIRWSSWGVTRRGKWRQWVERDSFGGSGCEGKKDEAGWRAHATKVGLLRTEIYGKDLTEEDGTDQDQVLRRRSKAPEELWPWSTWEILSPLQLWEQGRKRCDKKKLRRLKDSNFSIN